MSFLSNVTSIEDVYKAKNRSMNHERKVFIENAENNVISIIGAQTIIRDRITLKHWQKIEEISEYISRGGEMVKEIEEKDSYSCENCGDYLREKENIFCTKCQN